MLCGDFILPESANYVSLLCGFQFAQLIVHYQAVMGGDGNGIVQEGENRCAYTRIHFFI